MDDPGPPRRRFRPPWAGRGRASALSRRLAVAATAWLFWLGPWPVDDTGYVASDYQAATLARLAGAPAVPEPGPIRLGTAEVDLSPSVARPLAGFIGQVRTPFVGVDTPCFARALTIRSASTTVTILTADLLLINARLARAVEERSGSRPGEIYFTASHTHGGPGGWGSHPLEMLVAGAYDPAAFDELAGRLAESVRRSRADPVAVEVGFVEVQSRGRQTNRIDPTLPTHDALSAMVFRPVDGGPPLAILAVFGAHATVSHPVPPRLGGDYPASLARELRRRAGAGVVAFAAGAVGDASPARPRAATQQASAEALGVALAADLAAALPSARFGRDVVLANLRLDVDLPALRLPFFAAGLRFSPMATWWIADRRAHLHGLRVGPVVLVGFPGDYAGHLADRLARPPGGEGPRAVVTSFNGDFKGYLVSGSTFRDRACYETRWMSFFGPWTGDYLTDLAGRMVVQMGGRPPGAGPPGATPPGLVVERSGLSLLLLLGGVPGWRRAGEVRRRFGGWGATSKVLVVAALGTVVAFLVDPGSIAWARVGLPRMAPTVGLAAGVLGVAWSWSRSRPRALARGAVALVVAAFLVTASWPVFLAALRVGALGPVAVEATPDGRAY